MSITRVITAATRIGVRYGWQASWAVLVLAAILVGIDISQARAVVGDQTNISYMLFGWSFDGSLNFMTQHTNLMKMPLLWLQVNLFDYNMFSLMLMNILMVAATVVGWSLLLGKVVRRRIVIVAVNLTLAGLLLGSNELAIDLTMATIRNIEYPIMLAYLLLLRGMLRHQPSRLHWAATGAVLALLIASDYFFIYSVPIAIIGAVAVLYFTGRLKLKPGLYIAGNTVAGAVAGVALLKVLAFLDILRLHDSPRPLVSYSDFWDSVQNTIFQTFKIFGGDFFGMEIRINSLARIGLAGFTLLAAFAIYRVIKAQNERLAIKPLKSAQNNKDEAFLIYIFAFMLLLTYGAYILSGFATATGENNRYLSIVPFVAVAFLALWLRNAPAKVLLLGGLAVLGLGVLCAPENHRGYNYQQSLYAQTVDLDKKIAAYMQDNGVRTGYGSLGYTSPVWFFSDRNVEVYNIQPCNVKNPVLSSGQWYKHYPNEPTALIVDRLPDRSASAETWYDCDETRIQEIYGKPSHRAVVAEHGGKPVEVWLFDYNIGTKLK